MTKFSECDFYSCDDCIDFARLHENAEDALRSALNDMWFARLEVKDICPITIYGYKVVASERDLGDPDIDQCAEFAYGRDEVKEFIEKTWGLEESKLK